MTVAKPSTPDAAPSNTSPSQFASATRESQFQPLNTASHVKTNSTVCHRIGFTSLTCAHNRFSTTASSAIACAQAIPNF